MLVNVFAKRLQQRDARPQPLLLLLRTFISLEVTARAAADHDSGQVLLAQRQLRLIGGQPEVAAAVIFRRSVQLDGRQRSSDTGVAFKVMGDALIIRGWTSVGGGGGGAGHSNGGG